LPLPTSIQRKRELLLAILREYVLRCRSELAEADLKTIREGRGPKPSLCVGGRT